MVAISVTAAASVATGILALSSVRNMAETISITSFKESSSSSPSSSTARDVAGENSLLQQYISTNRTGGTSLSVPQGKTSCSIVEDLKQMKRKELLALFLLCDAPEAEKDVIGSWDGTLLNNNSVLTSVSGFITNTLFGRRYDTWCGKAFGVNSSGEVIGSNRFRCKKDTTEIQLEHTFGVKISQSKLRGKGVLLDYGPYQGMLSPWKTMVDEVRFIRSNSRDEDGEDCSILIGMGSIGWSGGFLNSQPFCLARVSHEFQ